MRKRIYHAIDYSDNFKNPKIIQKATDVLEVQTQQCRPIVQQTRQYTQTGPERP